MRLFIAINPPPTVRASIAQLYSSPLWPHGLRPTPPKNLHLSLHFVGDPIPEELLPEIRILFHEACEGAEPMHFAVRGLGCFPNVRSPRVLWARVEGDAAPLDDLQQRIYRAFAGSADNQKFQPHITLARPKPSAGLGPLLRASESLEFGSWMAHEVVLIKSELRPGGARYEVLDAVVLT